LLGTLIENWHLLKVLVWSANFVKWRLLGLQAPSLGPRIPKIGRRVSIVNPRRVRLHEYTELRSYAIVRSVPGRVEIGAYTSVNEYAIVNAAESVSIGARVMIAPGCHITDADHDISGTGSMNTAPRKTKPVLIEDDVWLGANAVVTSGVRIGRGAVVAAGAVVTRSVAPLEIVGGVPAKTIGWRGGDPDRGKGAPVGQVGA
jgi:acetyltransferase-like isoleucine patch superfamily enzyme